MNFNAEMGRAILDDRKTQTRRLVKSDCMHICEKDDGAIWPWREHDSGGDYWYPCLFGEVGDRISVRKTWADVSNEGCPAVAYRAGGGVRDLHEDYGDEQDPNLEKYWFANWYPDLISDTEGN